MHSVRALSYLLLVLLVALFNGSVRGNSDIDRLPQLVGKSKAQADWLIDGSGYEAGVYRTKNQHEVAISNGLTTRTFRVAPNAATVGYDNLMTGESVIRGVKPEARITLDGMAFDVGGLKGQPNYAYILPEWIDDLTADPRAFQFSGFRTGKTKERFAWKRKRYSPDLPWPAPGASVTFDYRLSNGAILGLGDKPLPSEMGRKLLLKDDFHAIDQGWTLHNSSKHARSSFQNEGKVGEVYTPANTCAYAERQLPAGTRLIQCSVNSGTDKSGSWGPGLVVVWPARTIKFYVRSGEARFGIFDGRGERLTGSVDVSKTYHLRVRMVGQTIHCESSLDGEIWSLVHSIETAAALGDPVAVRLGKTSRAGSGDDFDGDTGDMGRCRIGAFRAYGEISNEAMQEITGRLAYLKDVTVSVHYELFDGSPLLSKWLTVHNGSNQAVQVNSFVNEILAAVEPESSVESRKGWMYPNIHVETDLAYHGMDSDGANKAVYWLPDPQYLTQVNYRRQTPCLLETKPPLGPDVSIPPGETFESFRTYVLVHDNTERERKGLAVRRLFRTVAPWAMENPIMMHVRSARPDAVRKGIDQCAEVGFEMIILTFGSGFNIENESPEYIGQIKELVDYAHSRGVEMGGYSLLASRRVSDEHDVVNPETGRPGGFAAFGNSPCIGSQWGQDYFRKLYNFYEKTGFDLLEHDGSYPGDFCASAKHPGHVGLGDSLWTQWKTITDFYKWCRARGVHLNVPDFYYLSGTNKSGMGYRETNWSLPRAQQIIHGRQNIFDGTWEKTPSMGWMFVPLTQYHGGGAAATIEPLAEHLDAYGAHLANNLASGVQACYRGPRLYDTDETKAVVKQWVDFYRAYRPILDSDIIHVRRADGRDIDCMMHVNPQLKHKGLAVVYNPLTESVERTLVLPLYYTGLTKQAKIRREEGPFNSFTLDREYKVHIPMKMKPQSVTWFVIEQTQEVRR